MYMYIGIMYVCRILNQCLAKRFPINSGWTLNNLRIKSEWSNVFKRRYSLRIDFFASSVAIIMQPE